MAGTQSRSDGLFSDNPDFHPAHLVTSVPVSKGFPRRIGMMEYGWTREIEDIACEFSVDINKGLTGAQVKSSLQKYGKNGTSHSRSSLRAGIACRFPALCFDLLLIWGFV